jgi:hypothetical protein
MARRRHGRAAGVAAGLCVVALATSIFAPPSWSAEPVTKVIGQSPAAIRDYWTKARMEHAQPLADLLPGLPDLGMESNEPVAKGGTSAHEVTLVRRFPYRTNGKVFGTIGGFDYECSATAVRSSNHSVVWTAGHCVADPGLLGPDFASNWEFVPAYRNGSRPFGEWPAAQLRTTRQWGGSGLFSGGENGYDLGAATVARRNGKTLQGRIGARRIGFGQPRNKVYSAFGYPVDYPFDGERQYRCVSPYAGADNSVSPPSIRIPCNMTAGASGGGWVIKRVIRRHRKRHRRRLVASVTSYSYVDDPNYLYGPYQGPVAKSLWRSAGG